VPGGATYVEVCIMADDNDYFPLAREAKRAMEAMGVPNPVMTENILIDLAASGVRGDKVFRVPFDFTVHWEGHAEVTVRAEDADHARRLVEEWAQYAPAEQVARHSDDGWFPEVDVEFPEDPAVVREDGAEG
jgi:hypothetical protein